MWILFLYSPRPYDIDMIRILQLLKAREVGWLTQEGTVCTYQSQGLNPVLETLKHPFILLPSVASCMFISWEFSSYTVVVSKGNAMPWLRSWTSTSFVHAFNSRAPTTVCQAYSHRNKSVDKFRCSYLAKTSRIQPPVLPPGSNSVSSPVLLATMLSPLFPYCLFSAQQLQWPGWNAIRLRHSHSKPYIAPLHKARVLLPSAVWPPQAPWLRSGFVLATLAPLLFLLRHTRPPPTSGLYTCFVSKAVFPRCLCGWPATPAVFRWPVTSVRSFLTS